MVLTREIFFFQRKKSVLENPIPWLTQTVHNFEQLNKRYFVIQCFRWVGHNLTYVSSFFKFPIIASQFLCGSPPNSHVLQEFGTIVI